jgi:hypothetical protein
VPPVPPVLRSRRGAPPKSPLPLPLPKMPPPSGQAAVGKGITVWGATATGKTSFLAALYATLYAQETGWRLRGDDQASEDKLVELTDKLVNQREFPDASAGLETYHWSLVGEMPNTEWRWYGPRRRPADVVIPLTVVDAAGEVSRANTTMQREVTQRFVGHLANSTGIVFFYDPIREFDKQDAFEHTFGVLTRLDSRMKPHGKLPHHVAVCVTKFDQWRMFEAARQMGIVDYDIDPPYFPRVMERDAREFFKQLCHVSKTRTARLVLELLEGTFHKDRIRYFVTSSIGFYVDQYSGVFDQRDYQQHIRRATDDDMDRVRGDVWPINVVEPIMWLGQQVTRAAGV